MKSFIIFSVVLVLLSISFSWFIGRLRIRRFERMFGCQFPRDKAERDKIVCNVIERIERSLWANDGSAQDLVELARFAGFGNEVERFLATDRT